MTTHDTKLVAAALVFKLLKYADNLDALPDRSAADSRKLLRMRTSALVLTDRIRTIKARKLNGRF